MAATKTMGANPQMSRYEFYRRTVMADTNGSLRLSTQDRPEVISGMIADIADTLFWLEGDDDYLQGSAAAAKMELCISDTKDNLARAVVIWREKMGRTR